MEVDVVGNISKSSVVDHIDFDNLLTAGDDVVDVQNVDLEGWG
jgi:hypothetical protein